MKNLLILAFCSISLLTYAQFSSNTTKQIDVIENNAASDILLKPNDKVDIDYFLGEKALQSTVDGELEESNVTNTELSYVSGVVSNIQTQIDSKQPTLTGTDGDLYYYNSGLANLSIGTSSQILSVSALGFPEWIDLPPSVSVENKGDLQTYSTMPDRLPVGSDTQILSANSATSTGLEWIDVPVSLPDQTGNEGLYLTTNGTDASWNEINEDVNEIKNNFLECSGFDGCTQEGTITNGAGVDASSIVARTVETTAFNPSKLNLSQTLAGTLDYTYTKAASYDSKQLVAYCEIKTANTGVTFSAGADSVEAGSLEVSSDDSWKYYKIPLVGGATDQYFKIDHSDAGTIPDIDVDNCFIGKSPDTIKELGQAYFVGSQFSQNTNCVWGRSATSWGTPPADADCNYTNTGEIQRPDTNIAAIKIPNPKINGFYRVRFSGMLYNAATGSGTCAYTLSTDNTFQNKEQVDVNTAENRRAYHIEGTFRFNDTATKTINVLTQGSSISEICRIYADGARDRSSVWNVEFFPDDNSTVVTQDTELTAKTANELSAKIDSSGNIDSENYSGWISSVTGWTTTTVTINFENGIFTTAPKVLISDSVTGNRNCKAKNITISSAQVECRDSSGVQLNIGIELEIDASKQGTDVNKSATIVGKFENINSSDIAIVEAYQVTSQTLTDNTPTPITFDTELFDNYNAYNTSTGEFTCPKVAKFKVSYNVHFQNLDISSESIQLLNITSSGVVQKELVRQTDVGTNASKAIGGSTIIDCDSTSRVYAFNALCNEIDNTTCTTRAGTLGSVAFSNLSVHEIPDTESIIKNLSQQKTEYQLKNLTVSVSSTGDIAELSYSNLDTSKYYRININPDLVYSSNSTCRLEMFNDGVVIVRALSSHDATGSPNDRFKFSSTRVFKPTNSTLTARFTEEGTGCTLAGTLTFSGTATYVELEELPDNYVETNKF